ncbi:hypothetical protein PYW07_009112 [Mythimna separata]|uniref:Uncharacterized protein n=1 Tax=Mythimna separata TaxID=271217 RepID=A0AAD8DMX0_MYTSE|nr:hypothetical protein PYW07_009112 [Mythimna separata]
MKAFIVLCSIISIVYCKTLGAHSGIHRGSDRICINMWDEGCSNGQLGGAGNDDDYLNGGFNPGKRCVNMWDDGCVNGQLGGSGNDDNYLGGGFNPGRRQLDDSANDDDYLNGNWHPGKRSLQSLLQKLKNINHEQHH